MIAPKPVLEKSAAVPDAIERDEQIHLRLYLAGSTPSSRRAVVNLEAALAEFTNRLAFNIEQVDVLRDTKRATADGVIMTPTLIAVGRESRQVIIGDLSETRKLQEFLRVVAS